MTADSTTKRGKSFDCVAYQREQRDRISRKLEAMTQEERHDWLHNVEVGRLSSVAEIRLSNVDTHTHAHEQPVDLCNYMGAYRNDPYSRCSRLHAGNREHPGSYSSLDRG